MRFLLAAGVIAAIGSGSSSGRCSGDAEVAAISEDVRADSARTVVRRRRRRPCRAGIRAPTCPSAPERAAASTSPTPSWSSNSFPVARANPYDVPGDPNTSMVGIAPRAPRARAAMARKRVFTEQDLLATRGGWSAPAPVPASEEDDDDNDDD